ncbi:MAG: cobyrinate a,c-diamide synthase [Clostridia bacterium]|nr:cobyrinate a,c-diamide synthase [Clostridia bacterium]
MKKDIKRVIIAGTNSGCGKTTVTCALLKALKNRGLDIGAFKCGPDYIDPMFHRKVIGLQSFNLDSYFYDDNTLKYLLSENGKDRDINIIEGVMGFYDGLGINSVEGSTYDVSEKLSSPVVLVLNGKGASLSILATLQGFLTLYRNNIKGVIINSCTESTYRILASEIEKRFSVKALGFLPRISECSLESRHLGLVTADEVKDLDTKLKKLADTISETVDLQALLSIAEGAEALEYDEIDIPVMEKVRIGVPKDNAFSFYYQDNLNLLSRMGSELIYFSPLTDNHLPEDLDGLYIGGGYPELYKDTLSKNETLLKEIKEAILSGLPIIAECGGFMYLSSSIEGHSMAGVFPAGSFNTGKLGRFGYIKMTAKVDSMIADSGDVSLGHEFHYYDTDDSGDGFL